MERCAIAMRRLPHDQKLKPEVNSRDVIKLMSKASISVTITDIWTKFCTEHKYRIINTAEWPNSQKLKIQDGGRRRPEFRKYVNNFRLDKDILHHSLNGSSDSVNGVLQFLWDRQISTPHKINTPERSTKNSAQLITSARGPLIPNLVEIHLLGASGQMGEI